MSAAHETKMRKMILATMTHAILPSCALLQLRYINIVHLLLWCCGFGGNNKSETNAKQKWFMFSGKPATIGDFRKSSVGSFARGDWRLKYYPLRKGLTLIPFMVQSILEDIQICVLISSTSEQVSFFIKRYFISEDCTFQ